jgi:hypothetical protein
MSCARFTGLILGLGVFFLSSAVASAQRPLRSGGMPGAPSIAPAANNFPIPGMLNLGVPMGGMPMGTTGQQPASSAVGNSGLNMPTLGGNTQSSNQPFFANPANWPSYVNPYANPYPGYANPYLNPYAAFVMNPLFNNPMTNPYYVNPFNGLPFPSPFMPPLTGNPFLNNMAANPFGNPLNANPFGNNPFPNPFNNNNNLFNGGNPVNVNRPAVPANN